MPFEVLYSSPPRATKTLVTYVFLKGIYEVAMT